MRPECVPNAATHTALGERAAPQLRANVAAAAWHTASRRRGGSPPAAGRCVPRTLLPWLHGCDTALRQRATCFAALVPRMWKDRSCAASIVSRCPYCTVRLVNFAAACARGAVSRVCLCCAVKRRCKASTGSSLFANVQTRLAMIGEAVVRLLSSRGAHHGAPAPLYPQANAQPGVKRLGQ